MQKKFLKVVFPFYGMLREIIMHGIAALLEPNEGIFDYDPIRGIVLGDNYNEEFSVFLENKYQKFSRKVGGMTGSKLGKNDRDSYAKSLGSLFGMQVPSTYIDLFLAIIENVYRFLRSDHFLDFERSLNSIIIKKNEIVLGEEKNARAIVPAIIKQAEFYEYGSAFNRPTTGIKMNIRMDPIWFSILSVGFLSTYAGYFGGDYYITYFSGIETFFSDRKKLRRIVETIDLISVTNIRLRTPYEIAELFEFSLALELVDVISERGFSSVELEFPIVLAKIGLIGNTYTVRDYVEIDLDTLMRFIDAYYKSYQAETYDVDRKIMVKYGKKEISFKTPLNALLFLATKELQTDVGDNEFSAYLMVKDLYRAVNSGSKKLVEDALLRILRNNTLLQKRKAKSRLYAVVLRHFSERENIEALLDAIEHTR